VEEDGGGWQNSLAYLHFRFLLSPYKGGGFSFGNTYLAAEEYQNGILDHNTCEMEIGAPSRSG